MSTPLNTAVPVRAGDVYETTASTEPGRMRLGERRENSLVRASEGSYVSRRVELMWLMTAVPLRGARREGVGGGRAGEVMAVDEKG